jgi:predicted acetyltransferase
VDTAALVTVLGNVPVYDRRPWMIRLVDAAAAVAARGWPPGLRAQIDLRLHDRECPWNDGPARLVLDAGQARLEPGGSGATGLTSRGLSLLYAGWTPGVLRRAGLLTGADPAADALLAAAFAGPPAEILDYF